MFRDKAARHAIVGKHITGKRRSKSFRWGAPHFSCVSAYIPRCVFSPTVFVLALLSFGRMWEIPDGLSHVSWWDLNAHDILFENRIHIGFLVADVNNAFASRRRTELCGVEPHRLQDRLAFLTGVH